MSTNSTNSQNTLSALYQATEQAYEKCRKGHRRAIKARKAWERADRALQRAKKAFADVDAELSVSGEHMNGVFFELRKELSAWEAEKKMQQLHGKKHSEIAKRWDECFARLAKAQERWHARCDKLKTANDKRNKAEEAWEAARKQERQATIAAMEAAYPTWSLYSAQYVHLHERTYTE